MIIRNSHTNISWSLNISAATQLVWGCPQMEKSLTIFDDYLLQKNKCHVWLAQLPKRPFTFQVNESMQFTLIYSMLLNILYPIIFPHS